MRSSWDTKASSRPTESICLVISFSWVNASWIDISQGETGLLMFTVFRYTVVVLCVVIGVSVSRSPSDPGHLTGRTWLHPSRYDNTYLQITQRGELQGSSFGVCFPVDNRVIIATDGNVTVSIRLLMNEKCWTCIVLLLLSSSRNHAFRNTCLFLKKNVH